jgi:adenine-specific DNA-methyltransferase
MGKEYEKREEIDVYLAKQKPILKILVSMLKPNGSLCWQVGNFVDRDRIVPLDIEFHRMFSELGLKLQNRIIWHFGHGLHSKRRFSGRYEVVLWYTKGPRYKFNLDAVRIKPKYPGKKAYKGKNKGRYSSNPRGKNPEDVWAIPNVKGNHVEKTDHPCQFPVGLAERLVLALTNKGDLVYDPYCGVASAGVAALHHGRRFVGSERVLKYARMGLTRLTRASHQTERFRPHDLPIYDHTKSKLSVVPET